jgi:hypothetical protein
MALSTWFISVICAALGILLGAGIVVWHHRVKELEKRRIPKDWPLKTRPMVNSRERRVWVWLNKVMADQQILVKLPVTRFTTPQEQKEASHWYQLLNGLYCTFTVCAIDGVVIGCIDVPGKQGLLQGNQTLKHRLLGQCGVPYWVVDPENLPHTKQIRAAFLGELATPPSRGNELDTRFRDVRENLQAVVTKQRLNKHGHLAALEAQLARESGYGEGRIASGWEQNSFITPLDSRASPLEP